MSGIVGVYAAIGEHIPILSKEKLGVPHPEGEISRYHYRGTVMIILVLSLLVTTTEWISGTDSIINCLHTGAIPDHVMESFCYIMGTFSVPHHFVDSEHQIGEQISQSGIGPYNPRNDYIEVQTYYQWVPFMLFLQAIMFYIPHILFKWFEAKKVVTILNGLNTWILRRNKRLTKEAQLASYIHQSFGTHRQWTQKILFAQSLYLVNVVGQIFFTDCFLGWQFTTYGVRAASFLENQQEDRVDPMSRVFPRVTKCTFPKYGPSGTIQRHDAQCILPINIINEKIYVFLWFWFCILTPLTFLNLTWSIFLVFSSTSTRKSIIERKLKLSPRWFMMSARDSKVGGVKLRASKVRKILRNRKGRDHSVAQHMSDDKLREVLYNQKVSKYYFGAAVGDSVYDDSMHLPLTDCEEKGNGCYIDVNLIVDFLDYGDWKLFYHLLRNMDALVFSELCRRLCELLDPKRFPPIIIPPDTSDSETNSDNESKKDSDDEGSQKSVKKKEKRKFINPFSNAPDDLEMGDDVDLFNNREGEMVNEEEEEGEGERRDSFYTSKSEESSDMKHSSKMLFSKTGKTSSSKKDKHDIRRKRLTGKQSTNNVAHHNLKTPKISHV